MQLQKSLKQYQKIPKSEFLQYVDGGAGTIYGVRRIFAWILPNLPEKTP